MKELLEGLKRINEISEKRSLTQYEQEYKDAISLILNKIKK